MTITTVTPGAVHHFSVNNKCKMVGGNSPDRGREPLQVQEHDFHDTPHPPTRPSTPLRAGGFPVYLGP